MKKSFGAAVAILLAATALSNARSLEREEMISLDVAAISLTMTMAEAAEKLLASGYEHRGLQRQADGFFEVYENGEERAVLIEDYTDSDDVEKVGRVVFMQGFDEIQPMERTREAVMSKYGESTRSGENYLTYNMPFQFDHDFYQACKERRICTNHFKPDLQSLGLTYNEADRLYHSETRLPYLKAMWNENQLQIDLAWPGAQKDAWDRQTEEREAEAAVAAVVAEQERQTALENSKPVDLGF